MIELYWRLDVTFRMVLALGILLLAGCSSSAPSTAPSTDAGAVDQAAAPAQWMISPLIRK